MPIQINEIEVVASPSDPRPATPPATPSGQARAEDLSEQLAAWHSTQHYLSSRLRAD